MAEQEKNARIQQLAREAQKATTHGDINGDGVPETFEFGDPFNSGLFRNIDNYEAINAHDLSSGGWDGRYPEEDNNPFYAKLRANIRLNKK